jgi:hypothetical protein
MSERRGRRAPFACRAVEETKPHDGHRSATSACALRSRPASGHVGGEKPESPCRASGHVHRGRVRTVASGGSRRSPRPRPGTTAGTVRHRGPSSTSPRSAPSRPSPRRAHGPLRPPRGRPTSPGNRHPRRQGGLRGVRRWPSEPPPFQPAFQDGPLPTRVTSGHPVCERLRRVTVQSLVARHEPLPWLPLSVVHPQFEQPSCRVRTA